MAREPAGGHRSVEAAHYTERHVERIGILGFPNTGKTTLFNALTGHQATTAPHPFSTAEPNVGVAKVPDAALDELARLGGAAKVAHVSLEVLDLPAMVKPGHGEGLGAHFLGRLREADALAAVLRAFEDPRVTDYESGTDPVTQAEELLLELALADFEVFDRRRQRVAKEATADAGLRPVAEAIAAAAGVLEQGEALRRHRWSEAQRLHFRDLAPLTLKPVVWVINVAEDDDEGAALVDKVIQVVPPGDAVVGLSARLEEEAAQLPPDDRAELYEGLGLGEGALFRIVHAAHEALHTVTFYTVSPNEAHAWTVPAGTRAPGAAGKVHSDFERGFIRAEVAPIETVNEAGGWDAAKQQGLVRVEGKDYVVADGDVLLIRFSV